MGHEQEGVPPAPAPSSPEKREVLILTYFAAHNAAG